jgi:hypothetical protein
VVAQLRIGRCHPRSGSRGASDPPPGDRVCGRCNSASWRPDVRALQFRLLATGCAGAAIPPPGDRMCGRCNSVTRAVEESPGLLAPSPHPGTLARGHATDPPCRSGDRRQAGLARGPPQPSGDSRRAPEPHLRIAQRPPPQLAGVGVAPDVSRRQRRGLAFGKPPSSRGTPAVLSRRTGIHGDTRGLTYGDARDARGLTHGDTRDTRGLRTGAIAAPATRWRIEPSHACPASREARPRPGQAARAPTRKAPEDRDEDLHRHDAPALSREVPPPPVLVLQQDRRTVRGGPGRKRADRPPLTTAASRFT